MTEYIERESAVKVFNNFDAGRADSPPFTLLTPKEFAEYLYELPTADVAPVVHGRWVDNGIPDSMLSGCSVCGFTCGSSSFFYCPICGAKMDESDEPENEARH